VNNLLIWFSDFAFVEVLNLRLILGSTMDEEKRKNAVIK